VVPSATRFYRPLPRHLSRRLASVHEADGLGSQYSQEMARMTKVGNTGGRRERTADCASIDSRGVQPSHGRTSPHENPIPAALPDTSHGFNRVVSINIGVERRRLRGTVAQGHYRSARHGLRLFCDMSGGWCGEGRPWRHDAWLREEVLSDGRGDGDAVDVSEDAPMKPPGSRIRHDNRGPAPGAVADRCAGHRLVNLSAFVFRGRRAARGRRRRARRWCWRARRDPNRRQALR
jgi:hypothetical protein